MLSLLGLVFLLLDVVVLLLVVDVVVGVRPFLDPFLVRALLILAPLAPGLPSLVLLGLVLGALGLCTTLLFQRLPVC